MTYPLVVGINEIPGPVNPFINNHFNFKVNLSNLKLHWLNYA